MWVPTEVPKLIHQQHLRDAQTRLQYRQVRNANRRPREPKSSPRRAVGRGLVRLGLRILASAGAGTSSAARSSC